MPLIDPNLAASWAAAYEGGYARSNTVLVGLIQNDAMMLRQRLGVTAGQTVAMMGAGFGFEAEEWIAAGIGPIVCCDYSSWIQSFKQNNATLTILNEDGSNANSQRNIKQAAGIAANAKFDWAVSCDTMPWLTDTECTRLSTFMHNMANNVGHLISIAEVNPPAVGNWKLLTVWKTFFGGSDFIVERGREYRML
jgi:hypothetical protein